MLEGQRFPDVELPSTLGRNINLARLPGLMVCFVYPYTGRPGVLDPEGWDHITGAHGSTPQNAAYSAAYPEFVKRNVSVFGLSADQQDWQAEFATRLGLSFGLLSDAAFEFSHALGLETFVAGSRRFLRRRTFVAMDGLVLHDRSIVDPPEQDAGAVLDWLRETVP
jgi:peroxiredoxin